MKTLTAIVILVAYCLGVRGQGTVQLNNRIAGLVDLPCEFWFIAWRAS
ncbi:MAG: hypothetical protein HY735_21825 [Verrucomicrobia bacterium]|nr:hypothetical protein [Verrucomicrobiota bacterium]